MIRSGQYDSEALKTFEAKTKVSHIQDFRKQKTKLDLVAQTQKQKTYLNLLRTYDQVVCTGCAGTGKTYVATVFALQMLLDHKIEKIILTRPNVSGSKSLGFFPGSLEEKIAPWVVPFTSIMEEHMGKGWLECAMKAGKIEIVPFEVMRGRTFNNAFVIVDEAQNLTPSEVKLVTSRIGRESKLVLNGDVQQSDIKGDSGLAVVMMMVERYELPVGSIEFDEDDIVRSDICALWIKAFNRMRI